VTDRQIKIAGASVRGWLGVGLVDYSGQVDTSGQQFPDKSHENSSCPLTGNQSPPPDHLTTFDALDPLAQLAHCLRVRPETTATDSDKQALAKHFSGLNGTAGAASDRLWTYWRAAPAPTVGDFLAHEPKAKGGAA
jgi:hypothetical protein